jgi:VIT family
MSNGPAARKSDRPLEPVERISEALFGLIMVLTFTCSISIGESGREDVRTMLVGAFGCNLVWGVIDAILYLMACLAERAKQEPAARPRLGGKDWLAALGIFLWVFLITLPVAVPFVLVHDVRLALRISNGVAVALLFLAGHAFGRTAGLNPWWTGMVMVLLGGALVAATIALGG